MIKKVKSSNKGTRVLLIISGLISILLAYLLWQGIWTIEMIIAIILFLAGLFKIIIGATK
jgi:hypothetical protein